MGLLGQKGEWVVGCGGWDGWVCGWMAHGLKKEKDRGYWDQGMGGEMSSRWGWLVGGWVAGVYGLVCGWVGGWVGGLVDGWVGVWVG